MATPRKPFTFKLEDRPRLLRLADKDPEMAYIVWESRKAPGLVSLHWNQKDGRVVGVFDGREAVGGVEDDGKHDLPWYTLCLIPDNEHGGIVHHRTRAIAEKWAVEPKSWCDGCRDGVTWRAK